MVNSVTPFLWFDGNAEEAMNFYCTLFKNSKVHMVQRQGPDGAAFLVEFELEGTRFMALNGGPMYKLSEAFSMFVSVDTQVDIDYYWSALTADGGEESMCGWLKDKFGVSWQIIPTALGRLMGDPDPARSQRAMNAMFQMRKFDIQALEDAANG